jgi:hypothetical protein
MLVVDRRGQLSLAQELPVVVRAAASSGRIT